MKDDSKPQRGRPSPFSKALGKGVKGNVRYPEAIHILRKKYEFKRLMNWMAMNEKFREKILALVPKKDPPLPAQPPIPDPKDDADDSLEEWQ